MKFNNSAGSTATASTNKNRTSVAGSKQVMLPPLSMVISNIFNSNAIHRAPVQQVQQPFNYTYSQNNTQDYIYTDDFSKLSPNKQMILLRKQCNICKKVCSRPSTLKTHLLIHTGDTPFKCTWDGCYKSFNVKSNMLRHLKSHERKLEKKYN